ncbi:hypothetical protein AGMMS49921_03290 [Endomicrobiia bacterium]|nr:hypothetical protein AGMMS49921_03290 [Endomicrobiia bacterium]
MRANWHKRFIVVKTISDRYEIEEIAFGFLRFNLKLEIYNFKFLKKGSNFCKRRNFRLQQSYAEVFTPANTW